MLNQFKTMSSDTNCEPIIDGATLPRLGESPRCIWIDSNNEMRIELGNGFEISPGDNIILRTSAGGTFSNNLGKSEENNPTLALEVSAPSKVSKCGGTSTNFFANALVDGGAGKAPNISWTPVLGSTFSQEATQFITDASAKNSLVLSIPAEYLQVGTHTINVTAQDWLGTSDWKTFEFTVVADQSIPIVSAGSPQNITIRENEPLELQLKAEVPSCTDANGGKVKIDTIWTSDPPNIEGVSSQTTLFFSLKPNTLSAGNTYRFTASVSSVLEGASTLGFSSIAFFVTVQEEPLSVYIKGGLQRTISVISQPQTLSFTASLATSGLSPPPAVTYRWSIQNGTGAYLLSQNDRKRLSISTSQLQLPASSSTSSVFTVSVSVSRNSSGATGSSNATQILEIVTSGEVPEVRVKRRMRSKAGGASAAPTEKLDIKNSIRLEASVDWKSETFVESRNVSWICTSGNMDLALSQQHSSQFSSRNYLVLPSGLLLPGLTYTFRVLAKSPASNFYGKAEINVITNRAPRLGSCSLAPTSGVALQTMFAFSCVGWSDEDLPLTYQWQAKTTTTGKGYFDLCAPRRMGSFETKLGGSGDSSSTTSSSSSTVNLRARIVDSLGAAAVIEMTASVSQPTTLALVEEKTHLGELLEQGDTETFASEFAGVISYLEVSRREQKVNVSSGQSTRKGLMDLLSQESRTNGRLSASTSTALLEATTNFVDPAEIDVRTRETAVSMLKNLTSSDRDLGDDSSVTDFVSTALSAVSNLLSASSSSSSSQQSSAAASGQERGTGFIDGVDNVIRNLQSAMVSSAVEGEEQSNSSSLEREDRVQIRMAARVLTGSDAARSSLAMGQSAVQFPPFPQKYNSTPMQLSVLTIAGDSLYPPPNNTVPGFSEGLISIEVADFSTGQEIKINNASEPFLFSIPRGNATTQILQDSSSSSSPSSLSSLSSSCVFWNKTGSTWASAGVMATGRSSDGRLQCKSFHLTSFTSEVRREVRLEVNQLSSDDVTNTNSLNPAKNGMMAFVISIVGLALLLAPFARMYDQHQMQQQGTESVAKIERSFWRSWNTARKTHATGERSCQNLCSGVKWVLRRKHPWFAVLARPNGDYMNAQKRLLLLTVIILNSAAVCGLLLGTSQSVSILPGPAAVGLVTCLLAFPVPFCLIWLFSRPVPNKYLVKFQVWSGLSILAFLMILLEDVEVPMESEGDGGNDDGAGAGEDKDHKDDDEKAEDQAEDHAVVGGAAVGATAGWMSGERTKKASTPPSRSPKSSDNNHSGELQLEAKSEKKLRRRDSMALFKDDDAASSSALSKLQRRQSTINWKFRAEESHEVMLLSDVIGISICLILILGCSFLIATLSYRANATNGKAVLATILALGQSISLRVFVIFLLEVALLGPCCALVCCCFHHTRVSNVDEDSLSSKRNVRCITLPCDEPTCTIGQDLRVDHVFEKGRSSGIEIGWRVVRINGENVETADQATEAFRIAYAMSDTVDVFFEQPTSKDEKRRSQHSANGESGFQLPGASADNIVIGGDQYRHYSSAVTSGKVHVSDFYEARQQMLNISASEWISDDEDSNVGPEPLFMDDS
eukprot:jgi/Bigna1/133872/aug1.23_g8580